MTELAFPLVSLSVLAPLFAAGLIFRMQSEVLRQRIAIGALSVSAVLSIEGLRQLTASGAAYLPEPWGIPMFGESRPLFGVDSLNAVPMALFACLALATTIVAPRRDRDPRSLAGLLVLTSSTLLVYASGNLILLLIGWACSLIPFLRSRTAAAGRFIHMAGMASMLGGVALIGAPAIQAGMAAPFHMFDLTRSANHGGTLAFALLMFGACVLAFSPSIHGCSERSRSSQFLPLPC